MPDLIAFKVAPPKLIPWLSRDERKRSLIMLDFVADSSDGAAFTFSINVVFNPIPVKGGFVEKADYYIGSTGAEITFDADGGSIKNATKSQSLPVDYVNSTRRKRSKALSIEPKIKFGKGEAESEASLGSITLDAETEREFTSSFHSEERVLDTALTDDSIKWLITLPKTDFVIRDYLFGNLYLDVTAIWPQATRAGVINVRLSDLRFFGTDRKPFSRNKSVLMYFVLWWKRAWLENSEGVEVKFEGTR